MSCGCVYREGVGSGEVTLVAGAEGTHAAADACFVSRQQGNSGLVTEPWLVTISCGMASACYAGSKHGMASAYETVFPQTQLRRGAPPDNADRRCQHALVPRVHARYHVSSKNNKITIPQPIIVPSLETFLYYTFVHVFVTKLSKLNQI